MIEAYFLLMLQNRLGEMHGRAIFLQEVIQTFRLTLALPSLICGCYCFPGSVSYPKSHKRKEHKGAEPGTLLRVWPGKDAL